MKVEKTDKGIMAFAPIALVAGIAVLAVPLLPPGLAAIRALPDVVELTVGTEAAEDQHVLGLRVIFVAASVPC